MSTPAHPPVPQHDGPLADHSRNDMPAARTIVVLVIVLLAVFSIVASIIYFYEDRNAPAQPAVEQPVIEDGRGTE